VAARTLQWQSVGVSWALVGRKLHSIDCTLLGEGNASAAQILKELVPF
jgi:hypothetical protein